MAVNTEGKLTTEDFEKLLGSNTYAKPTHAEEAINMLTAVSDVAMALTGGKPCIASMGYAYAVTITVMWKYTRPIHCNQYGASG